MALILYEILVTCVDEGDFQLLLLEEDGVYYKTGERRVILIS